MFDSMPGQTTEKGACSIGCHDNFFQFDGEVEEAVDVDVAKGKGADGRLASTARTPCATDTVVVPAGYNVNFLAMGFHAFKSVAIKGGGDNQVVEIKAARDLPRYMLFPTRDTKVHLGDAVIDQCAAHGMLTDDDRCVCKLTEE